MATIKRMDLAWITVSDFNRSKKFFAETLGLTLVADTPEYNWMELQASEGGVGLGVGAAGDKESSEYKLVPPGSNSVVTMTVDNLDAAKADFEAKGVKFVGEIVEVPGHVKMVFFVDPDNNKFQLVEMLDTSCC